MNKEKLEQLKDIILHELDAAGYFIQDYDSTVMKKNNPDWKPYSTKSFGEQLMDFAQYYNISEENRDYVAFERKDCPVWRRGKPEETGSAYLLNFKDGRLEISNCYEQFNNSFYFFEIKNGDYYYTKVSADDKNLRWLYVHELNNLPKEF